MRTILIALALFLPFSLSAKDAPEAILKGLPQTIAGCERGEIEGFGDVRLGCATSYKTPGMVITVYAYDQGRAEIADGIADRFVAGSFQKAKDDVQTALAQGHYSAVKILSDGKASFEGGLETLCARYNLTRAKGADAGLVMFSEIHMFGARQHLIKLRVSGESAQEPALGKVVAQFMPAFIKAIQSR